MTENATVTSKTRPENASATTTDRRNPIVSMLLYAFALFIMKGLSLLMLPIITRFLSPEVIGQLEIIAVSTSFIGLFFSLSLHEVLYRFVAQKSGSAQNKAAAELFWLTLLCSTVGAALLTTVVQLTSPNLYGLSKDVLSLAALSLSIEGGLAVGLAWLRLQDRVRLFCAICVAGSALQVALVLVALNANWGVFGIVSAGVIAHSLQLFTLVLVTGFTRVLPDIHTIQRYLKYCVPMMLSGLCAFGLNGAERYFIAESSGLVALGYFAIAAKFALAMCVLVQPFGMWWMPKRFAMLTDNPQKACDITQLGIVLVCTLAIIVTFFGQFGITFILPQSYAPVATIISGTIFMVLGKECAELLNLSLLSQKRTVSLLRINITITLITLAGCYLLMDHGLWALMIAVGVGQLIRALTILLVGQYGQRLPYSYITLSSTLLVTIAAILGLSLSSHALMSLVTTLGALGILAAIASTLVTQSRSYQTPRGLSDWRHKLSRTLTQQRVKS
ncbi:oligosaccharide flippase family protein [Vibrio sp. qd031]|uniref:lipopolysaccharide biosynthesis protein n=1 Tax=Vibrio sp. qd031 TaxID=1603038 RepID=UPI000A11834C|nr:oligosaccharide flippase family protein [Vibrio sp. qd031]